MNRLWFWVGGAILIAASLLLLMCSRNGGKGTQTPAQKSPDATNLVSRPGAKQLRSSETQPKEPDEEEDVEPDMEEELPLVTTGLPSCDSYIERYLRCKSIPYRERKIQRTTFEAWKKHVDSGAESKGLGDSCKATSEVQGPSMTKLGC